jgi:DNA-binding NtrC family response regulator
VIRLHLPPLRERPGDIQLLIAHFLNRLSSKLGKNKPALSRKALNALMSYSYPGNVRELRNIVEYAVNICDSRKIKYEHLPSYLMEAERNDNRGYIRNESARLVPAIESNNRYQPEFDKGWSEIEKQMILNALVKAGGRKSKAAQSLGWSRSTLWRKMKQHKIR